LRAPVALSALCGAARRQRSAAPQQHFSLRRTHAWDWRVARSAAAAPEPAMIIA
jgi:hypothetical protein